jgi:hypothetical protein
MIRKTKTRINKKLINTFLIVVLSIDQFGTSVIQNLYLLKCCFQVGNLVKMFRIKFQ